MSIRSSRWSVRIVAAVTGLFIGCGAHAAHSAADKPIKMDEPMSGEMKKEGTKKGDVKERAAQWDRKMKDMMEQEAKAMSRRDTKQ